jgi:hypothetical protein
MSEIGIMIPAWVDGVLDPRRKAGGASEGLCAQGGFGLRDAAMSGAAAAPREVQVPHAGAVGEHLLHFVGEVAADDQPQPNPEEVMDTIWVPACRSGRKGHRNALRGVHALAADLHA